MKIEETLKMSVNEYAEELENLAEKNDWEEWANYFDDIPDVYYTIDRHGRLKDVTIYLGIGGSTYYIDTRECEICGKWGLNKEGKALSLETIDKILEYWEQEFEYLKEYSLQKAY